MKREKIQDEIDRRIAAIDEAREVLKDGDPYKETYRLIRDELVDLSWWLENK
jgi:hypothetical protein